MALRYSARLLASNTSAAAANTGFLGALRSWAAGASGFAKYGLRREDLISEEGSDIIAEAVSRLPAHEAEARHFRLKRAINLSLQFEYLPKDQQTKPEEDTAYLSPYIAQVKKEHEERARWNSN